MNLPYRAEYSKSGRAECKGCKLSIPQGDLRLAAWVQSFAFDGKTPQWYHFDCFFQKQRPKTTDDIEHFESLRVEDQDKIKSHVGVASMVIVPDNESKKRTADTALKEVALNDFKIEYAKSGRAICSGCGQRIFKDEVRISKKNFETELRRKHEGQDMWHHVSCFAQVRAELAYFECGDKLPGFESLKEDDQADVKKQILPIQQEDILEVKKIKTEDSVDGDPKEEEYREQNKIMFQYRDQLNNLRLKNLAQLLKYNNQNPSKGKDEMLDQLADAMTYGSLKRCPKCKKGQLKFNKMGYVCTGYITEWTKCLNVEKEPERVPFKIEDTFKKAHSFLEKYKYVPRTRVVKEINSTVALNRQRERKIAFSFTSRKSKVKRALPPLYDMEFVIVGQLTRSKDKVKKLITSLGGKVTTKIKNNIMAVISTVEEVEKNNRRMQEAENCQIHVVSEDFLDEAKEYAENIPDLICKKNICNWGTDPSTRLPPVPTTSRSKSKFRSVYTSSVPRKIKLKVKDGSAVDPNSGLEDVVHVYQEGDEKYTVVLGITDIQTKKNSYYKLQLLADDTSDSYWLFRAWGRIGTIIGNNTTEPMSSLDEAKSHFMNIYKKRTGNNWGDHKNFVKMRGKMYPIDLDYGKADNSLAIAEAESNLVKPVQDLIRMIFDINMMKKLMAEFELDTEKMPLGKFSKAQILKAYAVLNELQQLIDSGNPDETALLDASNRFYTFIPHSFGIDDPPILNEAEAIKQKLEMLDSLMELEIAYGLMSSESEHTVDGYYEKLHTDIGVLDRKSEEFAIIQEYIKNTHAKTHSSYDLEIKEAYSIKREGEDKRFEPLRKLHNHKLLWHGSRVTNFAGILSQGLRIAPPEAPVTGYMFGKGVYFADMVSKSANYCNTDVEDSTCLLLLCQVALGNMHELLHSKYITELPEGKHSTKGVGRTEPDPEGAKTIDGIEVPAGKGRDNPAAINSSLLYNEYVIYDIAQVNIKYLLMLDFKYKYSSLL